MFNYYGGKSRIARHYPSPRYNIIIEPFAGAANYSLLHYEKNIFLNEKDKRVYDIWKWLINEAKPNDLLEMKEFKRGDDLRNREFKCKELRELIRFCICFGSPNHKTRNIVTEWGSESINAKIIKMARTIPRVKHWKILYGDYEELPNIKATWFIDPPYMKGGKGYDIHKINYKELAKWCTTRRGQVIVCENQHGTWMNFRPLVKSVGIYKRKHTEYIWTNDNHKNITEYL